MPGRVEVCYDRWVVSSRLPVTGVVRAKGKISSKLFFTAEAQRREGGAEGHGFLLVKSLPSLFFTVEAQRRRDLLLIKSKNCLQIFYSHPSREGH